LTHEQSVQRERPLSAVATGPLDGDHDLIESDGIPVSIFHQAEDGQRLSGIKAPGQIGDDLRKIPVHQAEAGMKGVMDFGIEEGQERPEVE
jgi:hypothetical protein